jgi:hypothetical protein
VQRCSKGQRCRGGGGAEEVLQTCRGGAAEVQGGAGRCRGGTEEVQRCKGTEVVMMCSHVDVQRYKGAEVHNCRGEDVKCVAEVQRCRGAEVHQSSRSDGVKR